MEEIRIRAATAADVPAIVDIVARRAVELYSGRITGGGSAAEPEEVPKIERG